MGPSGDRGHGHARTLPLNWRGCSRGGAWPQATRKKNKGRATMPIVTWDHIHLRSPDPEATAAWLEVILGGVIIRRPGPTALKLGAANGSTAPATTGYAFSPRPGTPQPGLRH